jgi:hypothetical protein
VLHWQHVQLQARACDATCRESQLINSGGFTRQNEAFERLPATLISVFDMDEGDGGIEAYEAARTGAFEELGKSIEGLARNEDVYRGTIGAYRLACVPLLCAPSAFYWTA